MRALVVTLLTIGGLAHADPGAIITTTGGAAPSDRLPLIIALHPQGGDADDFAAWLAQLPVRAHLVVPRSDDLAGKASWYRGESTDRGAPGVRAAAAAIAAQLPHYVDPARVAGAPIVFGISQGAIVALALGVIDRGDVGAVVSIAGRVPPALLPSAALSAPRPVVDEFHGTDDHTVPYAGARASIAALTAAGFTAHLHSYPGGHHPSDAAVADAFAALAADVAAAAAR